MSLNSNSSKKRISLRAMILTGLMISLSAFALIQVFNAVQIYGFPSMKTDAIDTSPSK